MKEFKFKELSTEEQEVVKSLAQYFNWQGGWGEDGFENWDLGSTLYKNRSIGIYGPITLED